MPIGNIDSGVKTHVLPAGWRWVRLGEVVVPAERIVSPMPGTTYRQIGVRLWGEGAYEREPMDGGATKYTRLFRVEAGDIIVNKIWARNGSVAVVPASLANCHGSAEFPIFSPKTERLDSRWMHWLTKTPGFWAQCDEKSRGTSGKNRIKPEQFLRVEIPLPPLAEQGRIVARIEALAGKIEEARSLRRQAAEEAKALSAASSRTCFSDSWPQVRLEELCPVITDGTHQTPRYTEDGAIFLSAQNIKPFRFMPEIHRKVSIEDFRAYTAHNKPQYGDVLLTRVGAGIGEAALIDQNIEFAIYVSIALIRTDKAKLLPEFLVHWLNSPAGRASSLRETLGKGHSQGNLNLKLLRGFLLPVPPLAEQRRIVAYLDGLKSQVDGLKTLGAETAAEMDALLPSILDRAFGGEL
jgi:type I restriction enzyme S subunit